MIERKMPPQRARVERAHLEKPRISASKGGYLVELPDGDVAWQPSMEFAKKFAREWIERQRAKP